MRIYSGGQLTVVLLYYANTSIHLFGQDMYVSVVF